eukprot:TRINITY_DN4491_c0_g3_i2.p1 TRINITY_DN4491_c0_g3~~TRINITY_DN4491_c0_g3_i2.p1  ORF type:complete len:388 (-),score=59.75 TRINITY_DN4491_c0_g3_i2:32-1195(-)
MKQRNILLLFFTLFFIKTASSTTGECTTYLKCDECSSLSNCGWCTTYSGISICLDGHQKGPTMNVTCIDWDFERYDCIDQDRCVYNTDCASCTETPGCGWCGTICTVGNENGPEDKTLVCPVWKYLESSCQDMQCEQFTNCGACTIQKNPSQSLGCGWCSKGLCTAGTQADAFIDRATCGTWIWSNGACEEPKCEAHSDCHSCVKDPSLNCGWCEEKQKCIKGFNNIPSEPCGNYLYGTCRETCFARGTNCSNCVENLRCGWCDGKCTKGNKETPLSVPRESCSPWLYGTCDERRCGEETSCKGCVDNGCHWCPHAEGAKCSSHFDLGCCEVCENCDDPPAPDWIESVEVILLTSIGTICSFLLLFSIGYTIKVYYWNKRHFYRKLA